MPPVQSPSHLGQSPPARGLSCNPWSSSAWQVKRSLYYNSAFTLIMSQTSWINAGLSGRGWRGDSKWKRRCTDLSAQASINCPVCRRGHLTIQTEGLTVTLSCLPLSANKTWSLGAFSEDVKSWMVLLLLRLHQLYAVSNTVTQHQHRSKFWFLVPGKDTCRGWAKDESEIWIWRHCIYTSNSLESQTFSTRFGPECWTISEPAAMSYYFQAAATL